MSKLFRKQAIEYQRNKLIGNIIINKPRSVQYGMGLFFTIFVSIVSILSFISYEASIEEMTPFALSTYGHTIGPDAFTALQNCRGKTVFISDNGSQKTEIKNLTISGSPDGGAILTAVTRTSPLDEYPRISVKCRYRLITQLF